MIYVIETVNEGDGHLMVNNALVHILLKNRNREPVVFYGDAAQISRIKEISQNDRLSFQAIKVQGNPSLYKLPFIVMAHLWLILKFLYKNRNGKNLIVFSYMFPVTHYFFKVFKKAFPKARVLVALHGELEFVRDNKKFLLKMLGKFLIAAFRIRCDKNTRYLVYGESIKQNMLAFPIGSAQEIIAIDHPYNYDQDDLAGAGGQTEGTDKTWHFGSVGIAVTKKNSQYIFELAKDTHDKGYDSRASFQIVGSLIDVLPFANTHVQYKNGNSFWKRDEYEDAVKNLDYTLFFYDNEYYKFTASGAFFDAIKFRKPILSLRNDFIDYNLAKFKDIGVQFNSVAEMSDYIAWLIDHKEEARTRYELQCQAIDAARKRLETATIAVDFWEKYDQAFG